MSALDELIAWASTHCVFAPGCREVPDQCQARAANERYPDLGMVCPADLVRRMRAPDEADGAQP
jgi:hypothetical protein